MPTARIRGRVLGPDGKPLRSAAVELFRADLYDDSSRGWWDFQGDEGFFEFRHVAPGDYLLVFNNRNEVDPDSPFSRTFYPSSSDVIRAERIRLRDGQQLVSADIQLSGGHATREIAVRIVSELPKLLEDAVVLARPSLGGEPFPKRIASGLYRLVLLRDAHYIVQASSICDYNCEEKGCGPAITANTKSVTVEGSDDFTPEITLVFPKDACPH